MTHAVLNILTAGLAIYALIGAAFALYFVWRGAPRLDPVAAQAPLRTRIIFIPGALALWPLLLPRAIRGHPCAGEHPRRPMHPLITRHRLIWLTLAPTLVLILIALIILAPTPTVTP